MKIVIPGGSGQVGHILARYFHARGHAVTVFSRSPRPAPWRVVGWDGRTAGDWIADLEQSDVCINLAGRSVDCRYTAANYRHALDRAMSEADGELGGNEPGAPDTWNFSIDMAKGWEEAFFSAAT